MSRRTRGNVAIPGGRPSEVLSLRALNRAMLARQGLLGRWDLPVPEAVERLVGLQAQTPHSWYVGLWARLGGFRPEQAADLLVDRRLVRIALMRSTIHLVTDRDCLALRPLVQPVIERTMAGSHGKRLTGVDTGALVATGRALLEERPLTFAELGARLAERWPDHDPAALAQAIRAWLPLVQVPPRGMWGRGGPIAHTPAEAWLGRPLDPDPSPEGMILRYLAAFGPATIRDAQTWSGLTRLREVVEALRPRLVTFRDEQGRELFDLPDAPRPNPDTPAPPRFLPDYDNALLSHADRSRIIAEEDRRRIWTSNGVLPGTVLVDGFVCGTWTIDRHRGAASLLIEPFAPLPKRDQDTLSEEGLRLLAFAAADAGDHDVRITPSGRPVHHRAGLAR